MGHSLRRVGKDRINNKYQVNETFFDNIDCEEKAYLLGLILSDGHVSKNGSLIFSFQKQDKDILEKMIKALESDYPIREDKKYVHLTVSSKKLCDRLVELGFNHRKIYGFDFEKLRENIP